MQLSAADNFSRQHSQMHFFLGLKGLVWSSVISLLSTFSQVYISKVSQQSLIKFHVKHQYHPVGGNAALGFWLIVFELWLPWQHIAQKDLMGKNFKKNLLKS